MRLNEIIVLAALLLVPTVAMADDCYESYVKIPKPFMGNNGEIFQLADGSVWEVGFEYEYMYAYNPDVIICPSSGKMYVEDEELDVKKLCGGGTPTIPVTPSEPGIYIYYSPYFKSDGWTGLAVTNLSAKKTTALIYIYSRDGSILAEESAVLDPYGQTHFLTGLSVQEDGWIQIASLNKLAPLCLAGIEGDNNYMADIPMTDTLSKDLVIPHVAYGPIFDTTVYISNPSIRTVNIDIAYVAMNGLLPYGKFTMTIPAKGCSQVPLSDLTYNNMINGGWVNITSDQGITAFAIYNNLKSGGRSFAGLNAFSK